MLNERIPDLGKKMADCTMEREGLLKNRWSYDYSVIWRGMEQLYQLTGDKRYFDYIRDAVDTFLVEEGAIRDYRRSDFNLDYLCNGKQLLYLYRETGDEKYMRAARLLRSQLDEHPRNEDGGLWHKQCYPHQMWLDGLHMAMPFLAEYTLMTDGDPAALEDVVNQFSLAYRHTYDPATGLNRHACDVSRQQAWACKETGQSAHAWGRAMGWYLLGLVDVIEILGRYGKRSEKLEKIYCAMAKKLLSIREDGVWMQVLDCPERMGNFHESSATFLMLCAMFKGVRLGLLEDALGAELCASYQSAMRHFIGQMQDGRLFVAKCCQVGGLGGRVYRDGSFDYYLSEPITSNDMKALGAMLQADCEWQRYDAAHRKEA